MLRFVHLVTYLCGYLAFFGFFEVLAGQVAKEGFELPTEIAYIVKSYFYGCFGYVVALGQQVGSNIRLPFLRMISRRGLSLLLRSFCSITSVVVHGFPELKVHDVYL